jgi:hypothetical protein
MRSIMELHTAHDTNARNSGRRDFMNEKMVHKVEVFDRLPHQPGFGSPLHVIIIHFGESELLLLRSAGKTTDSEARRIVRNLTSHDSGAHNLGRWMRITHPVIDFDALGDSIAYPTMPGRESG